MRRFTRSPSLIFLPYTRLYLQTMMPRPILAAVTFICLFCNGVHSSSAANSTTGHGPITIESYWVMPYRKNADIGLTNMSDITCEIAVEAEIAPLKWNDTRSLYFHVSWRQERAIFTTAPMKLTGALNGTSRISQEEVYTKATCFRSTTTPRYGTETSRQKHQGHPEPKKP